MTNALIHGGLYRETLRRLRVPSLVMFTLFTVFELFWTFLAYVDDIDIKTFMFYHPSLYAIPFVVPFLLVMIAFRFQNKRRDSDFYHSLPFTRTTLSLSMLAAVATWCAVIVIGSSVIIGIFPVCFMGSVHITDALFPVAACLTSSLFILMLSFLAVTLSGTSVSAVFTTLILLFAPHLIMQMLIDFPLTAYELYPQDAASPLNLNHLSLLYGSHDRLSAWIGTLVFSLLCCLAALWVCKHRPSETAGKAAVNNTTQIVLRLLITMLCCLPPIRMICTSSPYMILLILFEYLVALIVYFLYELFTTRKAKNMLKAIPWLGVVALLNLLFVLAYNLSPLLMSTFRPAPEQVNSISLVAINYYSQMPFHTYDYWGDPETNFEDYTEPYAYYKEHFDPITEKPLFSYSETDYTSDYEAFAQEYNSSNCKDIRVTDKDDITAACTALATALADIDKGHYASYTISENAYGTEWAVYSVHIDFHMGLLTHSRTVYLTESELIHLLRTINTTKPYAITLLENNPPL